MFAQAIGEYGAAGSLGASLQSAVYSASTYLGSISPTTWVLIAAAAIVLVILLRR